MEYLTTLAALRDLRKVQEEFQKASHPVEMIHVVACVLSRMDEDLLRQVDGSLHVGDSIATVKEKVTPFFTQYIQRQEEELTQQLEGERQEVLGKIEAIIEALRSEEREGNKGTEGIRIDRACMEVRAMLGAVDFRLPALDRLCEDLTRNPGIIRSNFLSIATKFLDENY
jgi:hypothetical protein